MPFALNDGPVLPRMEFKTAGVTIDTLGRHWSSDLHPRDSRGRFIETGGIARVWGGGLGTVLRALFGGKIEVQMGDGSHRIVPARQITMVRRPNGEKPTASKAKVTAEDAARDADPNRPNTALTRLERDKATHPVDLHNDPADEEVNNAWDGSPSDDDDPWEPSREDARRGDWMIVHATTPTGEDRFALAEVVGAKDGKANRVRLAGDTAPRPLDKLAGDRDRDVVIPREDIRDAKAIERRGINQGGKTAAYNTDQLETGIDGIVEHRSPLRRDGQEIARAVPRTGDATETSLGRTVAELAPGNDVSDEDLAPTKNAKDGSISLRLGGERQADGSVKGAKEVGHVGFIREVEPDSWEVRDANGNVIGKRKASWDNGVKFLASHLSKNGTPQAPARSEAEQSADKVDRADQIAPGVAEVTPAAPAVPKAPGRITNTRKSEGVVSPRDRVAAVAEQAAGDPNMALDTRARFRHAMAEAEQAMTANDEEGVAKALGNARESLAGMGDENSASYRAELDHLDKFVRQVREARAIGDQQQAAPNLPEPDPTPDAPVLTTATREGVEAIKTEWPEGSPVRILPATDGSNYTGARDKWSIVGPTRNNYMRVRESDHGTTVDVALDRLEHREPEHTETPEPQGALFDVPKAGEWTATMNKPKAKGSNLGPDGKRINPLHDDDGNHIPIRGGDAQEAHTPASAANGIATVSSGSMIQSNMTLREGPNGLDVHYSPGGQDEGRVGTLKDLGRGEYEVLDANGNSTGKKADSIDGAQNLLARHVYNNGVAPGKVEAPSTPDEAPKAIEDARKAKKAAHAAKAPARPQTPTTPDKSPELVPDGYEPTIKQSKVHYDLPTVEVEPYRTTDRNGNGVEVQSFFKNGMLYSSSTLRVNKDGSVKGAGGSVKAPANVRAELDRLAAGMPTVHHTTPTGANEAQYAKETAEASGYDPGFTVDGRKIKVTNPLNARYALVGLHDIHDDNQHEPSSPAADRRKAKGRADALKKLMDSIEESMTPEQRAQEKGYAPTERTRPTETPNTNTPDTGSTAEGGEHVRAADAGDRGDLGPERVPAQDQAPLADVPAEGDRGTARPGEPLHRPVTEGRGDGERRDRRPAGEGDAAGRPAGEGAADRRAAPAGGGSRADERGVPAAGGGRGSERASEVADPGALGDRSTEKNTAGVAPAGDASKVEPFELDTDNLSPREAKARARANLDAIKVWKQVTSEGRDATPEEKQVLARFGSWGALAEHMFNDQKHPEFADMRGELRNLLSEKEWLAARKTTRNAHYTDPHMAKAMWESLQGLGFNEGNVLEPGSGMGTFIGLAPENAHVTGVELDPITAGISSLLWSDRANIVNEGFQNVNVPDGVFDAVIGNVPFAEDRLSDPTGGNPDNLVMHDHFITKAFRGVKPGGLMLMLSSKGTLDKKDTAARKRLNELGDFLGAVRLPNRAHDKTAGTDVVTDIIVMRRRGDGEKPRGNEFVGLSDVTGSNGTTHPVNKFYAENPQYVLGDMNLVSGGRYGADATELKVDGDVKKLPEQLSRALRNIVADAKDHDLAMDVPDAPEGEGKKPVSADDLAAMIRRANPAEETRITAHEDGTFTIHEHGLEVPLTVPKTRADEMRALIGLRDVRQALIKEERTHIEDTPEMDRLRTELNTRYDAYVKRWGPVKRWKWATSGAIDPATGGKKKRMARDVPKEYRRDRTMFAVVDALEDFNNDTWLASDMNKKSGANSKAAVFEERVVRPAVPIERVDDPHEALSIAMDRTGGVDLHVVKNLLGLPTAEDAREALRGLVFEDPATGRLVDEQSYLSKPDVRKALAEAKALALTDPKWEENVHVLENALPPELRPEHIDARPGAPWIKPAYLTEYVRDRFGDHSAEVTNPGGGTGWSVDFHSNVGNEVLARQEWGVSHTWDAGKIFQSVIQQSPIVVTNTIDGKTVKNVADTLRANALAEKMLADFRSWLWSDEQRAEELSGEYNRRFNNLAEIDYTKRRVSVRGISERFKNFFTHQHAAVARITSQPTVLLAHEVGAGKTLEMQAGSMKLRELGLANKPAHVVPNHMLEQYASEFMQAFPNAKVLVARKDDLAGSGSADTRRKREAFAARAASGDWDAVIFTHSAFELMPVSPDRLEAYLDGELALMRRELEARMEAEGDSNKPDANVKRLQAQLDKYEEKIRKEIEGAREKGGVTFEDTGIDYMFVDEAHLFKNLMTSSRIQGAGLSGAKRARDVHVKLNFLRDSRGEDARIGTFATATPISNSMTEAHVMMRFMRPDLLEASGTLPFDRWAAAFGEVVTEPQVDITGQSFKIKSRFSRFSNLPEMLRVFRAFADVKTSEELDLPVPDVRGGKPKLIRVKPSRSQVAYFGSIAARAKALEAGGVDPKEDNLLKLSSDGRKAALDLRLSGIEDPESPKLTAAADQIASVWQKNRGNQYKVSRGSDKMHDTPGALQLVFMDLGTPKDPTPPAVNKVSDAIEPLQVATVSGHITREDARLRATPLLRKLKGEYVEMVALELGVDTSEWDEETTKGEMVESVLDELIPLDDSLEPRLLEKVEYDPTNPPWSAYQSLKDKLIARGVPVEQIRFIHEAKDDAAKAQLFADAREGRIQVLLGSTQKMGVGTNVQDRMVALHHLDVPWRPADLQQRDGRGIRQGNQNAEIDVYRYATDKSFDSYMWQAVARKQAFISAAMKGDLSVRSMDDLSQEALGAQEAVAAIAGSQWLMRKAGIDNAASKLAQSAEDHMRGVRQAKASIAKYDRDEHSHTNSIERLKRAVAKSVDTSGEKFKATIDGKVFDAAKDTDKPGADGKLVPKARTMADKALKRRLAEIFRDQGAARTEPDSNEWLPIGDLSGMELVGRVNYGSGDDLTSSRAYLEVAIKDLEPWAASLDLEELNPDSKVRPFASLEGMHGRLPKMLDREESYLKSAQSNKARAEKNATATWDKADDLDRAREHQKVINGIIESEAAWEGRERDEDSKIAYDALIEREKELSGRRGDGEAESAVQMVDAETPEFNPEDLPPLESIVSATKFYEQQSKPNADAWHKRADQMLDMTLADDPDVDEEVIEKAVEAALKSSDPDVSEQDVRTRVQERIDAARRKARVRKNRAESPTPVPEPSEGAPAKRGPQLDVVRPEGENQPTEAPVAPEVPGGQQVYEKWAAIWDRYNATANNPDAPAKDTDAARKFLYSNPDREHYAASARDRFLENQRGEQTRPVAESRQDGLDFTDTHHAEDQTIHEAAAEAETGHAADAILDGPSASKFVRDAMGSGYEPTRVPAGDLPDGALVRVHGTNLKPDGRIDRDGGGTKYGVLSRKGKRLFVEDDHGRYEVDPRDTAWNYSDYKPEASGGPSNGTPNTPEAPATETPVAPTLEERDTPEVEQAEATDAERAQQASEAAYEAAKDEGATEKEAHRAAAVAEADEATAAADVTAERPIPHAPETPEHAAAIDAIENPKTPTQLDSEKFPLTPQQQAVADAVVADGKDVKVEAKAGAGKTSTLEAIARRFQELKPDTKILYIAFNKSVQTEAEGRMPGNVESRTGHSLAWAWAGKDITDKRDRSGMLRRSDEIASHLGIRGELVLDGGEQIDPTMQAQMVMRAVDKFANSADDEVGYEHFGDSLNGLSDRDKVRMLGYAKKAWKDIQDKDGKVSVTFDHIRKMWALSKPDLTKAGHGARRGAGVLFLDEAQDTPPVLAKVVADQNMQKVIVGDADQAIYGFTGATDYLSTADADVALPLTKSWRFGPEVADAGNRFLQVLGSKDRVEGGGGPSTVVNGMTAPDAILVRSNGGMIGEIVAEQEAGRKVGVPKGTKQDLTSLVETARYLKGEGRAPSRMHEDLAPFRTWAEFQKAAEKGDDAKITMLNRIIEQFGIGGLERIIDGVIELDDKSGGDVLAGITTEVDGDTLSLTGKTWNLLQKFKAAGIRFQDAGFRWNGDKKAWQVAGDQAKRDGALDKLRELAAGLEGDAGEEPDVVVSTAHKAKGLEWGRVKIGEDFKGPRKDPQSGDLIMPSPEELKLAYVAVTRAEKELDPGSLGWVYEYTDANGGTPGVKPHEPHVDVPAEKVAEDRADLGLHETPVVDQTPEANAPEPAPVEERTVADLAEGDRFSINGNNYTVIGESDAISDDRRTLRVRLEGADRDQHYTLAKGTPIGDWIDAPEPRDRREVPEPTSNETTVATPDAAPDAAEAGAEERDLTPEERAAFLAAEPDSDPDAPELADDPALPRAERKRRQQERRRRRRRMRNWLNNFGNNNNQNNTPGGLTALGSPVPDLGELPFNGAGDGNSGDTAPEVGTTATPDVTPDVTPSTEWTIPHTDRDREPFETPASLVYDGMIAVVQDPATGQWFRGENLGSKRDDKKGIKTFRLLDRATGDQRTVTAKLDQPIIAYGNPSKGTVHYNPDVLRNHADYFVDGAVKDLTRSAAAMEADPLGADQEALDRVRRWRDNAIAEQTFRAGGGKQGDPLETPDVPEQATPEAVPAPINVAPEVQQRADTWINRAKARGLDVQTSELDSPNGAGLEVIVTDRDNGHVRVRVTPTGRGKGTTVDAVQVHREGGREFPLDVSGVGTAIDGLPTHDTEPLTWAKDDTGDVLHDEETGVSAHVFRKDGKWNLDTRINGETDRGAGQTDTREDAKKFAEQDFRTMRNRQRALAAFGGLDTLGQLNEGQWAHPEGAGVDSDVAAIREGRFVGLVWNDGHGQWQGKVWDLDDPNVRHPHFVSDNRDDLEQRTADHVEHLNQRATEANTPAPAAPDTSAPDTTEAPSAGVTPRAGDLLVNGARRIEGMDLPVDSATGQYVPDQINHLARGGEVVLADIGGQWQPGQFLSTRPSDEGRFRFLPAGSIEENQADLISPEELHSIRAMSRAEIPGDLTDASALAPGTLVTGHDGRKQVTGLFEGVSPKGNALVRDDNGSVHQIRNGGQVRPILGAYAPGQEPTESTFAPTPGVWEADGDRLAAGVPGEYAAGIVPDGQSGYNWTIAGAPGSNIDRISGSTPTQAAAKAAIEDALYLAATREVAPASITALPGDTAAGRDLKKRELADVLAEHASAHRGSEEDQLSSPESEEPAEAPAPVDGAPAGWVPTGDLEPGNVARVDGDNGNGEATTRTGHVLGTPEPVEVHQPGKPPRKGTRTIVGDNPDGTGDRDVVLSPEESVAAKADRDPATEGDNPQPRSVTEAQVLAGNVADHLPADSNGLGVYPGSTVTDRNNRSGVVLETSDLDVAVRWSGDKRGKRVRPGLLTVQEQNRPEGWTKGGQQVRLGSLVTTEDGTRHGVVTELAGDNVTVQTADGDHTLSAGDLKVVGVQNDTATATVREPSFDAPMSAEGVDVRPTELRRPDPIPEGTPTSRVNLKPEHQRVFDALGLDTDQTSTYDVQQAALRVRMGEPITAAQAAALSAWLNEQVASGGMTTAKARAIKRLINRIDAAGNRISGDAVAPVEQAAEATDGPTLRRVDSFTPGDVIALPDTATGSVEWGTIVASRPATNDNTGEVTPGATDVLLELPDGTRTQRTLTNDAEVYSLPSLPEDADEVAFEEPTSKVVQDRPYTEPRIGERIHDAADAVVDAALADGEGDSSIAEVAARATEAADGAGDARDHHNASRRLGTALEQSGVDEHSADLAHDAADAEAEYVAEHVREAIANTLTDAEPLPGESGKDTAARLRDRLRAAADEVDYDAAAERALRRAEAIDADEDTSIPTSTQQVVARRDMADALRADLFAFADQLAGMGNVEDANTLSQVAARLAGHPDPAHVEAAVQAATMGRDRSKVRTLIDRIKAMFARQRARFLAAVHGHMGNSRGARALKAAVHAARAAWVHDDRDVDSLVKDAVNHLAGGVDRNSEVPNLSEPAAYADRIGYWMGQLPEDSENFARVQGRHGFGRLTPEELRSDRTVSAVHTNLTRLDRAGDGGPGVTASDHTRALHGLGRAHMDEVAARIRALHPDLGDDPATTVREAKRYAESMSADHRGDVDAAELARLREKAGADYEDKRTRFADARRTALLDVLAGQRPMGPAGAAALNVQGRSDSAEEVQALRWAERFVPTDWLASAGTVEAQAGRMSKYDDGTITVAPLTGSRLDGGEYGASALHGLARHLEETVPGLAAAGWAYHWQRTSAGPVGARKRRGRNALGYLRDLFPALGLDKSRTVRPGDYDLPWAGEETDETPRWLLALAWEDLFNGTDLLDDDTLYYVTGILGYFGRNR